MFGLNIGQSFLNTVPAFHNSRIELTINFTNSKVHFSLLRGELENRIQNQFILSNYFTNYESTVILEINKASEELSFSAMCLILNWGGGKIKCRNRNTKIRHEKQKSSENKYQFMNIKINAKKLIYFFIFIYYQFLM